MSKVKVMSHWHYWRWHRSRSTQPGPCTRPKRRTWGWGMWGRSRPGGWSPGPAAARPGWTRRAPPSTCSPPSRSAGGFEGFYDDWPEPSTAWLGGVWEDGLEAGEGGVGHTDNGPGDEGEEIHGDGVRDGAHEGEIHTLSKQETPSDQQYQISRAGSWWSSPYSLVFSDWPHQPHQHDCLASADLTSHQSGPSCRTQGPLAIFIENCKLTFTQMCV